MLINGSVALKGSSNDPAILEFSAATDVANGADLTSGIVKFANGLKIQWDTVDINADATTAVTLKEAYTEVHLSAMAIQAETVGDTNDQSDQMAFVPSTLPLSRVHLRNIAGLARSTTYISIGKDTVP